MPVPVLDTLQLSGKWPVINERKYMFTTVAVLALVSVPYVLDVYFNEVEKYESDEEEYVPDGR